MRQINKTQAATELLPLITAQKLHKIVDCILVVAIVACVGAACACAYASGKIAGVAAVESCVNAGASGYIIDTTSGAVRCLYE